MDLDVSTSSLLPARRQGHEGGRPGRTDRPAITGWVVKLPPVEDES